MPWPSTAVLTFAPDDPSIGVRIDEPAIWLKRGADMTMREAWEILDRLGWKLGFQGGDGAFHAFARPDAQ